MMSTLIYTNPELLEDALATIIEKPSDDAAIKSCTVMARLLNSGMKVCPGECSVSSISVVRDWRGPNNTLLKVAVVSINGRECSRVVPEGHSWLAAIVEAIDYLESEEAGNG